MSNFFDRRVKLLLVIVGPGVGISFLFSIHRDVGIGAAIIASYGGLYWLYRKTNPFNQKERYSIARYRGHPRQKKKFFL